MKAKKHSPFTARFEASLQNVKRGIIPGRQWRADFYFERQKIAVEVEGGTAFGMSRHSRAEGFERDCRKYNAATLAGIKVLRFTTAMVKSGEAIYDVLEALK